MQTVPGTEELALVQDDDDVERAGSPSVNTSRRFLGPVVALGTLLCVGVAAWMSLGHHHRQWHLSSADVSRVIAEQEASASNISVPNVTTEDVSTSVTLQTTLTTASPSTTEHISTTFALMHKFRVCTTCNHWERIGEYSDGGYLTCLDESAHWPPEAIYSFGISTSDRWSVDLAARLNISAYQFDCTIPGPPACIGCPPIPQLIHFYSTCIAARDNHENHFPGRSWNLSHALEHTGHLNARENSLIMKMDIEGSEWPILEVESREILSKFGTIIVEFHRFDFYWKFAQYLRAMEVLEGAGFQVAHTRGNNCCPMVKYGLDSIPMIMEVTLIRRSAPPNLTECQQGIQAQSSLDHKNLPGGPNIGPAYLAE
jgi:hypothetical protein